MTKKDDLELKAVQELLQENVSIFSQEQLTEKVNELVQEKNMTYMEALLEITKDVDYDIETFKKYISKSLYAKLELEAEKLYLLKTKSYRL